MENLLSFMGMLSKFIYNFCCKSPKRIQMPMSILILTKSHFCKNVDSVLKRWISTFSYLKKVIFYIN
jgi:hypothetical protein